MNLKCAVVSYLYNFGLFEGSSLSFEHTPVVTRVHKRIGDTIDDFVQSELVEKVNEVKINLGGFGGLLLRKINTGEHHFSVSFPNDDASLVKSSLYRNCHADLDFVSYKGYKTTRFHLECKLERYCLPALPGLMQEDPNDDSSPWITFDWRAHPCTPKVSGSIDVYITKK